MKRLAVTLSLAVFSVTLSSGLDMASASRMNGKCCMSSDGGRSYRYRMATQLASVPRTCSAYADLCLRVARTRDDRYPMCQAAKAQCMQTGVHVGPYSGRQFAGLQRM
jgi:hypothetical protein